MGILNVTPDSFYEGSRKQGTAAVAQAGKMLEEGATFLDIGGYSSRPGAAEVTPEEETARVIPAITSVLKEFPEALISVDTFRVSVAEKALDAGAALINDISGGQMDNDMIALVAERQVPYVMMHMRGTPATMQQMTDYENIIVEMIQYFSSRISLSRNCGVNDLIIDLGFGFAKDLDQNYLLLKNIHQFKILGVPIFTGISRKSMIYQTLGTSAVNALNGTTALHMAALMGGTSILRAHDVAPAVECIKLHTKMTEA